jgi:hypothetical protein
MKLYRPARPLEISTDPNCIYGGAIGFGFFMPAEITEEEIEEILRNGRLYMSTPDVRYKFIAQEILRKLNGG